MSVLQKVLIEIEIFKFHNLEEFTQGVTQWWYSPSQDIVMAMKNGEQPNVFSSDWIFVIETKDSSVAIKGQDDDMKNANDLFDSLIEAVLKENLICIGALFDLYRLAPNMISKAHRAKELSEAYDRRESIIKSSGVKEIKSGLASRSNWLDRKRIIDKEDGMR